MTMETAKSLREDFLHQNSFHEVDTYASMDKQVKMLRNILTFHRLGIQALARGASLREVINMPVREEIARARYVEETGLKKLDELEDRIKSDMSGQTAVGGEEDVA
jgi:V/A-type H+-transporting ATPase subunit A